jgi:hypothetical protein
MSVRRDPAACLAAIVRKNAVYSGSIFVGALLAQLALTSAGEAQESRVLQCDVAAMTVTATGEKQGPVSNHRFTIEFLPNGRAIWSIGNGVTDELRVTVGQTAYIFKHFNSEGDGFFLSIDRLTGALYGEAPFGKNTGGGVEREGSCRAIRVAPKL